jgi:hypothetical protein
MYHQVFLVNILDLVSIYWRAPEHRKARDAPISCCQTLLMRYFRCNEGSTAGVSPNQQKLDPDRRSRGNPFRKAASVSTDLTFDDWLPKLETWVDLFKQIHPAVVCQ